MVDGSGGGGGWCVVVVVGVGSRRWRVGCRLVVAVGGYWWVLVGVGGG